MQRQTKIKWIVYSSLAFVGNSNFIIRRIDLSVIYVRMYLNSKRKIPLFIEMPATRQRKVRAIKIKAHWTMRVSQLNHENKITPLQFSHGHFFTIWFIAMARGECPNCRLHSLNLIVSILKWISMFYNRNVKWHPTLRAHTHTQHTCSRKTSENLINSSRKTG